MSPAVSIRKSTQKDIQFSKTLTEVQTEYGLPSLEELEHEIDGYVDILLGESLLQYLALIYL